MGKMKWTASAIVLLISSASAQETRQAFTSSALPSSSARADKSHGSASAFDHAEYMQATATGQKKAVAAVKGSLSFNSDTKSVEFLDERGAPAFNIKYDAITSVLYEQTSTPRYAEAVLISPLFLFSHSKKHFLTIHFTDAAGAGQFVIIHLDKRNAREAVAATEAQTSKQVERVEEK
jgi:hypothetical protein